MKDFLKMSLATIVGLVAFSAITTVFSLFTIIGIAAIGNSQPQLPKEGLLKIDMSTFAITEQSTEANPLDMLTSGTETPANIGIWDAITAINAAATDPAVKYIYLLPDGVMGGIAQLEEFRTALKNFRSSGKAVISYIENPTNAGYYLASVSDKIFTTSYDGTMNTFCGISSKMIFLKDILDKIGINVQLIRHGKYKSAGEMFIRNSSSKENLEQNEAMVKSIWNSWGTTIAEARGITLEQLNSLLNDLKLNSADDFVKEGLVDEALSREDLNNKLATLYLTDNPDNIKSISFSDYVTVKKNEIKHSDKKVAVIYADGDIVDGNEKEAVAGDRFASIIAKVRKDPSVGAVVLRVNSPGGSVLASDKIKAELDLLREKVPVIASYGAYAASGGYWISANSDYIFSNATTLTGSIGVFSMIPDFSNTIKDNLHVTITHINSNKHSDMYSLMRPLDNAEIAYMQASVENIYNKFTSLVAKGRNMTVNAVDDIAQGRVWTGAEALEIGLVDQIGTIEDAIAYAAKSIEGVTEIQDVKVEAYPKPLTTVELLLESLNGSKEVFTGTPLEGVETAFRNWTKSQSGKAYARIPYEITIE
jgi:protease-4